MLCVGQAIEGVDVVAAAEDEECEIVASVLEFGTSFWGEWEGEAVEHGLKVEGVSGCGVGDVDVDCLLCEGG